MKRLIFILISFLLLTTMFSCGSSPAKEPNDLYATDWFWNFQTLPNGWQDNKFVNGENVDYGNGMFLNCKTTELKIRPLIDPPELESTFSPGYIQPSKAGDVITIKDVVGPVFIKVYYTADKDGEENIVNVKVNGKEIAFGENSPNTKTEKIVTATFEKKEKAEVTITAKNSLRIFDVMIIPME